MITNTRNWSPLVASIAVVNLGLQDHVIALIEWSTVAHD